MHQQLGGSPKDVATNMRRILNALAPFDIEGIAPSFDPPHIRVVLKDEGAMSDAFDAMANADLEPTIHSCVTIALPDTPGSLGRAMAALEHKGYRVESILVLPTQVGQGNVKVSFGISETEIRSWDETASETLASDVLSEL